MNPDSPGTIDRGAMQWPWYAARHVYLDYWTWLPRDCELLEQLHNV